MVNIVIRVICMTIILVSIIEVNKYEAMMWSF